MKSFFENGPQTIEELQKQILSGETKWIDRITYFYNKVVGSASYWRMKRAEVHTWIHYHISKGNGLPSFLLHYHVLNTTGLIL